MRQEVSPSCTTTTTGVYNMQGGKWGQRTPDQCLLSGCALFPGSLVQADVSDIRVENELSTCVAKSTHNFLHCADHRLCVKSTVCGSLIARSVVVGCLLAACPAFEKYPQLIDVSGAGALSPASRLVIGFGTGYALSCCAFNYHKCHNRHLSTWLSYGMSWKTFSMVFSSITFLLRGGSHMRDPPLPLPFSSFLLRSELLPQSSRELFTVK